MAITRLGTGAGSGSTKKTALSQMLKKPSAPVRKVTPIQTKIASSTTKAKPAVHTNAQLEREKLALKNPGKSISINPKKPIVINKPAVHTNAQLEREKLALKNPTKNVNIDPKKPVINKAKAPTITKPAVKTNPSVNVKPSVSTALPTASAPTNNGSKKTTVKTNTNIGSNPITKPDADYLKSMSRLSTLWTQASGYKQQIGDMLNQGFSYNPENDASYKSLQALAQKNAESAGVQAMEQMNDRGILNSTVTSDRIGHIQQGAQDQVTAMIPQLQAQAYGQYTDKLNNLYNMMTNIYGEAEKERAFGEDSKRWNAEFGENMRQYDSTMAENKRQFNERNGLDWAQFNFNKDQTGIENGFRQQGLDLDQLQYGLQELASIQDQSNFTDKKATDAAMSELLQFADAETAYNYLNQNAYKYYQAGASFNDLLTGLNKRWGSPSRDGNGQISFSN